jgi:hypothetical protein
VGVDDIRFLTANYSDAYLHYNRDVSRRHETFILPQKQFLTKNACRVTYFKVLPFDRIICHEDRMAFLPGIYTPKELQLAAPVCDSRGVLFSQTKNHLSGWFFYR